VERKHFPEAVKHLGQIRRVVAANLVLGLLTIIVGAANLGLSTIVDFERSRRDVSAEAVGAIRAVLETAGVEFTNGKRPSVRLMASRGRKDAK
jgi:hypothetical protein